MFNNYSDIEQMQLEVQWWAEPHINLNGIFLLGTLVKLLLLNSCVFQIFFVYLFKFKISYIIMSNETIDIILHIFLGFSLLVVIGYSIAFKNFKIKE